jgi:hypothetical protein
MNWRRRCRPQRHRLCDDWSVNGGRGLRCSYGCCFRYRRGFDRLRFWDGSAFEEIIAQRSFEVGDELAHGFSFWYAEGCGSGVSDGFKLWRFVIELRGSRRIVRGNRCCFMRNGSGKKCFTQRRFKIGDELMQHAGSRRDGDFGDWRLGGRLLIA